MNKSELVSTVAAKTGMTKKDTERQLDTILETIIESLAKGEKVQLVGFGAFEVRERAARVGRNINLKESVEIPATRSAQFKPGKLMKEAVEKS